VLLSSATSCSVRHQIRLTPTCRPRELAPPVTRSSVPLSRKPSGVLGRVGKRRVRAGQHPNDVAEYHRCETLARAAMRAQAAKCLMINRLADSATQTSTEFNARVSFCLRSSPVEGTWCTPLLLRTFLLDKPIYVQHHCCPWRLPVEGRARGRVRVCCGRVVGWESQPRVATAPAWLSTAVDSVGSDVGEDDADGVGRVERGNRSSDQAREGAG
jgi:hypothetical protein